jgi:hypothetical protein
VGIWFHWDVWVGDGFYPWTTCSHYLQNQRLQVSIPRRWVVKRSHYSVHTNNMGQIMICTNIIISPTINCPPLPASACCITSALSFWCQLPVTQQVSGSRTQENIWNYSPGRLAVCCKLSVYMEP